MSEPKIPKGFVMIYTETHSICMRIDHIVSVAVACGSNHHTLHITTRDGEIYKAAYNFEEFLKIMAEACEVVHAVEHWDEGRDTLSHVVEELDHVGGTAIRMRLMVEEMRGKE